jgi:hypothetical protein
MGNSTMTLARVTNLKIERKNQNPKKKEKGKGK